MREVAPIEVAAGSLIGVLSIFLWGRVLGWWIHA